MDLEVRTRPLSDPLAAQAARYLLEEDFSPDNRKQVDQWITRLERVGLEDPISIIEYAGRASGLLSLHKPSVYLRGEVDDLRLASAADAANAKWAFSGQPHLELGIGRPVHGMKVIWTENPELVARLLEGSMKVARSPRTASVVVAKAMPAVFQGSFKHGGLNFVAPVQAMIDGLSLGGQLAMTALTIARGW